MDNQSIETTRRRTERYWYQDGIWEIGFGLINLLLAANFALGRWVLQQRLPIPLVMLVQLATMLGIFLVMNRVIRALKERITYPRTGYVAYRRGPLQAHVRRILLIGLLSAVVAGGLALISASSATQGSTIIGTGLVIGAALVYLGFRFNLLRMFALAVLVLALGALISLLPIDEDVARVLFFGVYGLLFLLSGGLILAAYLRRTQPAGDGVDYEAPAHLEED
jgi:hypothetical protein